MSTLGYVLATTGALIVGSSSSWLAIGAGAALNWTGAWILVRWSS